MSSQNFWACLSVQDFFSHFNWQGYSQDEHFENKFSETSWLCLSVEDFFSQSNWQGQRLTIKQNLQRTFSLTLPVQEFFQYIAWEGKPQVAVIPQLTPVIKPIKSPTQDLSLNHLSDLF